VERQTGFTAEEVIGRDAMDFIAPESVDVIGEVLADQLARQRETDVDPPIPVMIEVEQYRKDGSTYPVEISAGFLRDPDGTPYGAIVVSRDITEKREATEALRKSEEHYRLLYDNAGEAIFSYDSELILTDINRRAGRETHPRDGHPSP
jgi:PAS domain S-box-containing protein